MQKIISKVSSTVSATVKEVRCPGNLRPNRIIIPGLDMFESQSYGYYSCFKLSDIDIMLNKYTTYW